MSKQKSASPPSQKIKPQPTHQTPDSIRDYLHEIGRIPLLTHEQELTYGAQVQQMMSLMEAKEELRQQLTQEPTDAEWAAKVKLSETDLHQILRQGRRAKQKMVEANLRLVVSIAKKYQKRNLEFLDLIQEGSLGLERATEKFDPSKGYKFSTYATWWIRQAITRAIANQARTIRLPIHITEKGNKIKRAYRELTQQLSRTPTQVEIAEALDLDLETLTAIGRYHSHPLSIDSPIQHKKGDSPRIERTKIVDGIPAEFDPQAALEMAEVKERVRQALSRLDPRQKAILEMRFGLETGTPQSLEQVARQFGLTRERIRQIEGKARGILKRDKSLRHLIPDL